MSPRKENQTRSEAVRQRRTQESTRRMAQTVVRAHHPIKPGSSQKAVKQKKTANKPQRQYNAFAATAARTQTPTIALPQIGWRWLSALLAILLGWALYLLWTSPQLTIAQAEVIGNQRLSTADINAVLSLSGQPVFTAVPAQLEQELLAAFPEIASVSITVSLPNLLTVNMTERQPIIAWQNADESVWIDQSGIAFPARDQADGIVTVHALGAPPPILSAVTEQNAPAVMPYLPQDLIAALQTLAPYVPAGTAIIYDPLNGLGWQDGRGWQVYFGLHMTEMQLKLRVYQSMVDYLLQNGIQPVMISVANPHAPYYRTR